MSQFFRGCHGRKSPHLEETPRGCRLPFIAIGAAAVMIFSSDSVASDAKLQEGMIDIESDAGLGLGANFPTKTLYQSKNDEHQWYYLPANIRFARSESGQPMFSLYKYNLVYNNGNFETDPAKQSEVAQGGTLKATFTTSLYPGELKKLEDGLTAYYAKKYGANPPAFKIARMPIDSGSFMFTMTDPLAPGGGKVALGPFPAPVSSDIIAVQEPITKAATDIFFSILKRKNPDTGEAIAVVDAPINVIMTFKYSGYDLDKKITVTGEWDNVYTATTTKAEVKANYMFFDANASYEDAMSELRQSAKINVKVDGYADDDPVVARTEAQAMEQIMKLAFDMSGLEPTAKDDLDEGAGKASGKQGELFGKPCGVSVGFAMKKVSRQKKGAINFTREGSRMIEKTDARYPVLSLEGLSPDSVLEITPGDWTVDAIRVSALDMDPYFQNASKRTGEWVISKHPLVVSQFRKSDLGKWIRTTLPNASVEPGGTEVSLGNFSAGTSDPYVDAVWTLPVSPVDYVAEKLGLSETTSKNSWNAVRTAMTSVLGTKLNLSGDMRLMSGVSLSPGEVPMIPELVSPKFYLEGPEDADYGSGQASLSIEQDLEVPVLDTTKTQPDPKKPAVPRTEPNQPPAVTLKKYTHRVSLKPFPVNSSIAFAGEESVPPVFIFTGDVVKETRLTGNVLGVKIPGKTGPAVVPVSSAAKKFIIANPSEMIIIDLFSLSGATRPQ